MMFCRTLPQNLNADATNAFETVTRMLSAEPPLGRTSTYEKREILNGLHAATLFSLGPGQEVFYKVPKRAGFDYGRGVIAEIEHDDEDAGGDTRLYLVQQESETIKTIGLDNVISHAEWLFDTKQSGGVRRPHAKTTTTRLRPRATIRPPPSASSRSPRTSPRTSHRTSPRTFTRSSPARTSQYRTVVPQVGPQRNMHPKTASSPRRNARPHTSPRRNNLRDFSPARSEQ